VSSGSGVATSVSELLYPCCLLVLGSRSCSWFPFLSLVPALVLLHPGRQRSPASEQHLRRLLCHRVPLIPLLYATVFLSYLYLCMNPFIYAIKHEAVKETLVRLMVWRKRVAVAAVADAPGRNVDSRNTAGQTHTAMARITA